MGSRRGWSPDPSVTLPIGVGYGAMPVLGQRSGLQDEGPCRLRSPLTRGLGQALNRRNGGGGGGTGAQKLVHEKMVRITFPFVNFSGLPLLNVGPRPGGGGGGCAFQSIVRGHSPTRGGGGTTTGPDATHKTWGGGRSCGGSSRGSGGGGG